MNRCLAACSGVRTAFAAAPFLLAGCASSGGVDEPFPVVPSVTQSPTGIHEAGRFVWHDLVTDDVAAAKQFYGGLFGWQFQDDDPGDRFTLITREGRRLGGIIRERRSGDEAPSRWYSSVSVAEVDQAAARAEAAGGQITAGPDDLPDRGRLVVVEDPQGASLVLFRATGGDPPEPEDFEHGDFLWTELWTTDSGEAVAYYEQVVGYSSEFSGDEVRRYYVLSMGGDPLAGIGQLPPGDADPAWLPYVAVDDVHAVVAAVPGLGGEVIIPPEATRRGNAAVLTDPAGAVIAVQEWPLDSDEEGE